MEARVSGLRCDLNRASVLFHDSLHRVEAEAGSFSNTLGREKGLKDVRLNLGWYSRTVIADFHDRARIVAIGSDAKFALSMHGVDGVVDDVRPDLVEFAAKGIHAKQLGRIVAHDGDTVLQLVIQDRCCGLQPFYDDDALK